MLGSSLTAFGYTRRAVHLCDHLSDCSCPLALVARSLASHCGDDPHRLGGKLLEFVAHELLLFEEVEHWFEVVIDFCVRRPPFRR